MPARRLNLRKQIVHNSALRTLFCPPHGELVVIIGSPSRSFALDSPSALAPHELVLVIPAIEHRTLQSVSLFGGGIARIFERLLRDYVRFAVCVARHSS